MPPPVPHRLTDPAFAALAAGRPDAATIAELRRAQLSRHLLLLRGIVEAAPTTTGRAYAHLAAAERRSPEAVRELLSYPLVGAWASGCLAALHAGAAPDDAGVAHLSELADAATLVADAPRAPSRTAGPATARAGHRLTAVHDGMRLDVTLDDVHPMRARLGLTPAGRLTPDEVARWRHLADAAWRLLVTRHRPYAQVIGAVLNCIVPVQPDDAARGISATSADAYGAAAMSLPSDATALAVGLLHETQHSLLNAVQYLFDLHRPAAGLIYSPWRDDPRPASGVLHGAYAYLGVTGFWRTERAAGTRAGRVAGFEFARWRAAVLGAADGLLGGGELTAAGTRFVGALRDRVLPWQDEDVPADVRRLAEGANTDHHLRWRLRNLRVDPDAVDRLAEAWRHRLPPPRGQVGATVVAAPRRFEAHARLDLAHRLLRDGDPPDGRDGDLPGRRDGDLPERRDGDLAYLRGDHRAAAAAYRIAVVSFPDDDAAWAGLGLTCDDAAALLRRRPELVAAVHRAVRRRHQAPQLAADGPDYPESAPDPVEIAAWLTPVG
jgi:hypothetical protein